jgi:raffinose/stachyose/melibiose transport system permease protein
MGLGGLAQNWLADPNIALWTIFFILTWKYIGFAILLMLAGLQGVPDELAEAAAIDGASWWQIQRHITLPLLGPTIRIWAFLSIIGSLQVFDMIWVTVSPAVRRIATESMATYMVQQGQFAGQPGYGSAIAVILFLISLVIALVYQRFALRRDLAGALTRGVR